MIGKKMKGSGFTDILIESGLMSVGSMKGVVSGKNYSRSINCHKVMAEAIERMLLLKYIDDTGSEVLTKNSQSELRRTVNHFVTNMDMESLEIVINEPTFVECLEKYTVFRTGSVKVHLVRLPNSGCHSCVVGAVFELGSQNE